MNMRFFAESADVLVRKALPAEFALRAHGGRGRPGSQLIESDAGATPC